VILLRAEKGADLTPAEADADVGAFVRASQSVTIAGSGAITVPGSGRYKLLPNSGVADDVTSILLTGENLEGTRIQLRPQTAGHTITIRHQGNIHLAQGIDAVLSTPRTTIWLFHEGANSWVQDGVVSYVP